MIGTFLTIAAVCGFGYYWAKDRIAHAKDVHVTLKFDQGSAQEKVFLRFYHKNKDKIYGMRIRIGEGYYSFSSRQKNDYSFSIDEENLSLIKEFISPDGDE